MTTPCVGALAAVTFAAAIGEAGCVSPWRMAGAHFGLTHRWRRSGEIDVKGRIAKVGDHGIRVALDEAVDIIRTRPVNGSALKGWEQGVANSAGMKKSRVALARRRAVLMHQMLKSGQAFSLTGLPQAAAGQKRGPGG